MAAGHEVTHVNVTPEEAGVGDIRCVASSFVDVAVAAVKIDEPADGR